MVNKDKLSRCFRGYAPDQCPMYRIEAEKMFYAVLLTITAGLLVLCTFVYH